MVWHGGRRGGDGVELRPPRLAEQRLAAAKLKDLTLPARFHQRYRIVAAAKAGESFPTVARSAPSVAYLRVDRFSSVAASLNLE